MKKYNTDCIKCGSANSVEIQMKETTENGTDVLIKKCTSCKKQSFLKEITDHIQSKIK